MVWKFEAIDKLRGYEAHKQALKSIPDEIARLESAFVSIKSGLKDGVRVSGGGGEQEDIMLSNIAHREELARTMEQAKKWVEIVENGLSVLSTEERLVLDRFYITPARGNVDRLCEDLCVEKASVYRRRDKALRKFTIALYGIVEN